MQIPAPFDYVRATTVDNALELLERHGPESRVIAGGHSLLPMMKLRLARPECADRHQRPRRAGYIRVDGDELRIGAMTRHADLLESDVVGEPFPIFRDAERVIADPIVRNRGTIGGSLVPGRPVRGPVRGVRRRWAPRWSSAARAASAIVTWPSSTAAPTRRPSAHGELLTESASPSAPARAAPTRRWSGAWATGRSPRPAPRSGSTDGTIADAGDRPGGRRPRHLAAEAAACCAAAARGGDLRRGRPARRERLRPVDDQRGPVDYKRHLADELTGARCGRR